MSTINVSSIRLAFRRVLLAIDPETVTEEIVAFENRAFVPPEGPDALWIREILIPAQETPAANDTLEFIGIMQYDVCSVPGNGTEQVEALAKKIKDAFIPQTSFRDAELDVEIALDRSEVSAGRDVSFVEDDRHKWWVAPVSVTFRCYKVNYKEN